MTYEEFIETKRIVIGHNGIDIDQSAVHPRLFDYQKDIVRWACHKGRCAVFADTGLGKTYISMEWARLMGQRTLFVAPLSVARQTVRMSSDIDVDLRYARNQAQVTDDCRLWITNYEMLEHFDASQFGAVVLDESSILKAIDGKTKQMLIDMFAETPYRLCCTATSSS
jgi:hypothetical protein